MFNFSREDTSIIAIWWRNIDKQILFSIILLFLLGLLFSFSSTSSLIGEKLDKETYFFFIKHLTFVFIALIVIFIISIQQREQLEKFLLFFFIASVFFLVMVPFFGVEIKGSKRWLDLPFLPRFQPVEFIKPFFILIVAKIITSEKKYNIYLKYLYSVFLLFFVIFFLINQPDIGQSLLIFFSWLCMIFASGINIFILISVGFLLISTLALIIFFSPLKFGYILYRMQSFFISEKGDNYQSYKALDAIKQGGLTGQGMGEGILKELVPEAHTDYIVAVISEEFGVLFVIFIVFIFLFITYKVINIIFIEKENYTKLVLIGLISILMIQVLIHLGVNTRLLPSTGMTLPFLSYGGSSLVGSSIIAGLILNYTKKLFRDFKQYE